MSPRVQRGAARNLILPGLLLAFVVTGTLPAWAGATSDRLPEPATSCERDSADSFGPARC